MIAAGLGCRARCEVEDIVRAVLQALEGAGRTLPEVHALYAPERKRGEPSLVAAAARLNKLLVLLPMAQLEAQASAALTSSAFAALHMGVPSVAETAALAGALTTTAAGRLARLLGPRHIFGGATCALASSEEAP